MTHATLRMPDISCYGSYQGNNYGMHTLAVDFGVVTVWYSYTTPIAFQAQGGPLIVHENDWSRTTGKHLRWIDNGNKQGRVSDEEFEAAWASQVAPFFDEDGAMAAAQADPPPQSSGGGRLPPAVRKILPIPKLKLAGT